MNLYLKKGQIIKGAWLISGFIHSQETQVQETQADLFHWLQFMIYDIPENDNINSKIFVNHAMLHSNVYPAAHPRGI